MENEKEGWDPLYSTPKKTRKKIQCPNAPKKKKRRGCIRDFVRRIPFMFSEDNEEDEYYGKFSSPCKKRL